MDNKIESVKLDELSLDQDLQPRSMINEVVIGEYAEAMQRGEVFPPISVFDDGVKKWVADGYHRFYAAQKANLDMISAEFRTGTKLDALKFSLSANSTHGLRRTQEDKKKAVITALTQFGELSNREIARMLKVDDKTVGKYRQAIQNIMSTCSKLREKMIAGDNDKTKEVKAKILAGASFMGFNAKDVNGNRGPMLIIVQMEGPFKNYYGDALEGTFTKLAYIEPDGASVVNEHGVSMGYLDYQIFTATNGLSMNDFDMWGEIDPTEKIYTDLFERS